MPKKKFEETPYDPIAADLMREVADGPSRNSALAAPVSANAENHDASENLPPPAGLLRSENRPVRGPEPTITKRFVLTRSENEDLEAFLLRVQKRAGTKLTLSVFTRATINVAMQAEEQLLAEVGEGIPRRFPSTHDSLAQGAFEEWWMRCLATALRKVPRGPASLRML
ncbi:MAG: hypothetical protein L0387_19375 [Acidobacteria bacterium]|nr:hypothetical protein [Acidobacteriota bacterium]